MNMSRRDVLKLGAGAIALGVASYPARAPEVAARSGTLASEHPATVATRWYRLILQLVRDTSGYTPPVAARAFGYVGVTLYEALIDAMPDHESLDGRLNSYSSIGHPSDLMLHPPTVANAALASIVRALFPHAPSDSQDQINALERAFAKEFRNSRSRLSLYRAVRYGQQVAAHVFEWSRSDGGHEGYLTNFPESYVPPIGPGLWVPTAPGFQPALQPYWSSNRPFAMSSAGEFDPGPPPSFSTQPDSQFYREALEVYEAVNNLTEEHHQIARFWADDPVKTPTPPGHSISILTQVLEEQSTTLAEAAHAYARVGIAMADAFITCWYSKFAYNLIRPITYVRTYIDSSWGSSLPVSTPPFPEYTSGHSVQTGAFARVMFDLFGDLPFTDHTHDDLGLDPRSFEAWSELAEETAISRLYGGIHFRSAIERGVEQGNAIGAFVTGLFEPMALPRPWWRGDLRSSSRQES